MSSTQVDCTQSQKNQNGIFIFLVKYSKQGEEANINFYLQ